MLELIEWLESQLETATEDGGNDIVPGVRVQEVSTVSDTEIHALLTDGRIVGFTLRMF